MSRTARTRHALALVAACALAPAAATAGESTGYLFDLDAPTILGIMDHYVGRGRYDERAILARMSAPLDCRHHSVLCNELGREYTYMVLDQAWSQGARGERVETIEAGMVELADTLAQRWVELSFPNGIDPRSPYFGDEFGTAEECTESVVFSDAGNFRLRQTSHVLDPGFAATRWARSEFNRKNSNGKYKAEKAGHIEIEAQFFGLGDLGVEVFFRSKAKDNEKAISVSAFAGGLGNYHVESCGKVTSPASLQACACSGPRPEIYNGF